MGSRLRAAGDPAGGRWHSPLVWGAQPKASAACSFCRCHAPQQRGAVGQPLQQGWRQRRQAVLPGQGPAARQLRPAGPRGDDRPRLLWQGLQGCASGSSA